MLVSSPLLFSLLGCRVGAGTSLAPRSLRGARTSFVSIGKNSQISCRFSRDRPSAQITIGDRCFIGASHLVAADRITIEDDVLISWGVTIVDHNSHALEWRDRRNDVIDWSRGLKDWKVVSCSEVVVKRRSWIGFNAVILKGVTVGEGAVVGACAVVTKDVAPYTVVGGNPARLIREIEPT